MALLNRPHPSRPPLCVRSRWGPGSTCKQWGALQPTTRESACREPPSERRWSGGAAGGEARRLGEWAQGQTRCGAPSRSPAGSERRAPVSGSPLPPHAVAAGLRAGGRLGWRQFPSDAGGHVSTRVFLLRTRPRLFCVGPSPPPLWGTGSRVPCMLTSVASVCPGDWLGPCNVADADSGKGPVASGSAGCGVPAGVAGATAFRSPPWLSQHPQTPTGRAGDGVRGHLSRSPQREPLPLWGHSPAEPSSPHLCRSHQPHPG